MNAIERVYGSKGIDLYMKLEANSTGFIPSEGRSVEREIDDLNSKLDSNSINSASRTEVTETVSSANGIITEFQSDAITENQNDIPIEFVKASNQPVIDFKIEGVDLESINEFLVSLLSQNEANSALFDSNMLNTLLLVPKLLKHTKGSTKYDSDAFIKNLMNKYFTDGKLNKPEKLIIDAAIKLSNAVYINIDGNNNTIRLNDGSSAKTAVDALNELKGLYSKDSDWELDMNSINTALNASFESRFYI